MSFLDVLGNDGYFKNLPKRRKEGCSTTNMNLKDVIIKEKSNKRQL